jgi:hypothetical protein
MCRCNQGAPLTPPRATVTLLMAANLPPSREGQDVAPKGKATLKGAHKVVSCRVTQELIDLAMPRDSNHCMVADAVKSALPHVKAVSVDLATIRFTDPVKRQRYIYLTPIRVQKALIEFDQGVHFGEFTFRLVKAVQVVESGRALQPDGSRRRPSEATQGVVGASGSKHPHQAGRQTAGSRFLTAFLPPSGPQAAFSARRRRLRFPLASVWNSTCPPLTVASCSPISNITLHGDLRVFVWFGLKQTVR